MGRTEFLKKRAQALLAGKNIKHLPIQGQARIVRAPGYRRYIIITRRGE